MTNTNWLIYGAYGYTGKLIVMEAIKKGHLPILAGRSAQKLQPFAEKLGLEWVVLDLADTNVLEQALSRVGLVLNAAGPFEETARPLVEACLNKRVHYLDIANEVAVYQLLLGFDQTAQSQGVALISGVGFGTVATNFIARKVAKLLPDAQNLSVGIVPYNYTTEPTVGAAKTAFDVIKSGGKLYKGGQLVAAPLGKGGKSITTPDGAQHSVMPIPLGDLSAAYLATGIPEVISYLEMSMNKTTQFMVPLLRLLLRINLIKKVLQNQAGRNTSEPAFDKGLDETKRSYAWASAKTRQGKELTIWLELREGYAFTAISSVKAVERVLNLQPKGTLTPAQVFEADFALEIEGVREIESSTTQGL